MVSEEPYNGIAEVSLASVLRFVESDCDVIKSHVVSHNQVVFDVWSLSVCPTFDII